MIKGRFLSKTNNSLSITTTWPVVVMLLLFLSFSCSKEKKETVAAVFDPETSFTLRTTKVSTLISDSGITRYRLNADEWLIYSKAKEPYWYFPKGLYVEKFDTLFNTEASVQADTAYNYDKKGLWKLVGNVRFQNLEGRTLETSLLFWDQKKEKIYSDKFVKIDDNGELITGVGFEAQQDLNRYQMFNTSAELTVEESAPADTATIAPQDTVQITNSVSDDHSNASPNESKGEKKKYKMAPKKIGNIQKFKLKQ